MMKTRGDLLRFDIAFAMRKLRFKRAPLGLSEEERERLANDAVMEMQRHGGWQTLDEPLDKDSSAPALRPDSPAS